MHRWKQRSPALVFASTLLYLLSYAPVLRLCDDGPYYRAPRVYRPVEWLASRAPFNKPLLAWARWCDNPYRQRIQITYFLQGVEDVSEMYHFNIAE